VGKANIARLAAEETRDMMKIRNFLKNSKGATAIEYGLIAALIAVAAIGAMSTLGKSLSNTFSNVNSQMKTIK
jgi:pilus assembly protein Flp/PilA